MTRLTSWPDGERYLRPPQSLVVFLFLSLVSTLFFSRTGGVLSHLKFSTPRFPRLPPKNLCSLVMLAVFPLVYAATDTTFFKFLSKIGRIESPSCCACGHPSQDTSLVRLILHCPATDSLRRSLFGDSLSLYLPGPGPGELPGFWGSMVFRHTPISRKGPGNQQQQQTKVFSSVFGKVS